jgi:methyltransferase
VTSAEFILGLVTLQRAGELVLSRYNTHRLLARGAVEIAPRHYLLIVAVHAAWLISLWVFGHDQPVNGVALLVYLVLQGFRFGVMRTLGSRWTTRIIVLPEQPLVSAGPYRFLSHPNYAVVAPRSPCCHWCWACRCWPPSSRSSTPQSSRSAYDPKTAPSPPPVRLVCVAHND